MNRVIEFDDLTEYSNLIVDCNTICCGYYKDLYLEDVNKKCKVDINLFNNLKRLECRNTEFIPGINFRQFKLVLAISDNLVVKDRRSAIKTYNDKFISALFGKTLRFVFKNYTKWKTFDQHDVVTNKLVFSKIEVKPKNCPMSDTIVMIDFEDNRLKRLYERVPLTTQAFKVNASVFIKDLTGLDIDLGQDDYKILELTVKSGSLKLDVVKKLISHISSKRKIFILDGE